MTNVTDKENNSKEETKQSWTEGFLDELLFGGGALIIIFIAILVIAILVATLGVDGSGQYSIQQNDKEKTDSLFIILIVVVLVILALVGGIRYLFRTDIYTSVKKDGDVNEIDIVFDHKTGDDEPKPKEDDTPKPQVFNIPGNYYNYDKAKNLCKAYGAELASYQQIEQAYQHGAEWCNYGWSQGQLALFPTQQATFDKLQKIPGHEQDCGRPGINGGFMANPQIEYGVNCFGIKPDINDEERFLMENKPLYPKTRKDKKDERQVERLKKQLGDILVSPFNSKTWSRY